jgi:hypothetical protein
MVHANCFHAFKGLVLCSSQHKQMSLVYSDTSANEDNSFLNHIH